MSKSCIHRIGELCCEPQVSADGVLGFCVGGRQQSVKFIDFKRFLKSVTSQDLIPTGMSKEWLLSTSQPRVRGQPRACDLSTALYSLSVFADSFFPGTFSPILDGLFINQSQVTFSISCYQLWLESIFVRLEQWHLCFIAAFTWNTFSIFHLRQHTSFLVNHVSYKQQIRKTVFNSSFQYVVLGFLLLG